MTPSFYTQNPGSMRKNPGRVKLQVFPNGFGVNRFVILSRESNAGEMALLYRNALCRVVRPNSDGHQQTPWSNGQKNATPFDLRFSTAYRIYRLRSLLGDELAILGAVWKDIFTFL